MRIQDRTFEFACRIARLYTALQTRHGVGRVLIRQLLRAGTSIGANLEEASAGQSKRDFISKCSIAAKEAREVHYWLRLLRAAGALHDDTDLVEEANELVAILTAIVRNALKRSGSDGSEDKRSDDDIREARILYVCPPIQHSTFNIQHFGIQKS